MSKRLIELSILTHDLQAAAEAWAHASDLRAEVESNEGRIKAGDVLIRFLSPESGVRPAELIARRGEGMFDLTIEVDNLVDTMADLRVKDVLVSGVAIGADGRREITIDPRSSHGVPIRLVEKG